MIRRMITRKKGERISNTIREKHMSKVRLTILFLRWLRGSVRMPMSGISPSLSRTARLRMMRKKIGYDANPDPFMVAFIHHLHDHLFQSQRKGDDDLIHGAGAHDLGKPIQFSEVKPLGQGFMIVVGQYPIEPEAQMPGPHDLIHGPFRYPAPAEQKNMLLLIPFTDKVSCAYQKNKPHQGGNAKTEKEWPQDQFVVGCKIAEDGHSPYYADAQDGIPEQGVFEDRRHPGFGTHADNG